MVDWKIWKSAEKEPAGPARATAWVRRESRNLVSELRGSPKASAALAAGLAMIAIGVYLYAKRPGDVSNPDAYFDPSAAPVQVEPEKGGSDWPIYGLNPQRTRYLPSKTVKPPFKVEWSFDGRKLLEYSPILVDNILYGINNNGQAFSLKAHNGKIRWFKDRATLNASAPAYDPENERLVIATLQPGQVQSLSAETGEVIWKRSLPGRTESSPVVIDGRVYVGCECGTLYALDAKSGKTVWETGLGGAVKAAPAYNKGILFVGDYGGKMSAVRASNGSIKWQSEGQGSGLGRAGNFYATAAVGFGRVYAGNIDGRMYSFEEETGELAWSKSTGGYVYAAAVVADVPKAGPTVYFGSYSGTLYALDARSGSERWSAEAGGPVSGASTLIGDTVYVASLTKKRVRGFRAHDGKFVFRWKDGAYNPVISDGKRLYMTGYETIYGLEPISQAEFEKRLKDKAAREKKGGKKKPKKR